MDDALMSKLLVAQRNEITEHVVYDKLAALNRNPHNKKVLEDISADELKHYEYWKSKTGRDIAPRRLTIWKYYLISRFLGLTFGVKLMERGEERAKGVYGKIMEEIPETAGTLADEVSHEKALTDMIDEDMLKYVGSMVLGLNDALVEFMGALAGFTLALQNSRLIAMVGFITGIAAALSMAASEYLSQKSEKEDGDTTSPLRAAMYTGIAYIAAVFLLVAPFLVFSNPFMALALTVITAIVIIVVFTFYISVAKELAFWNRFVEMAAVCLGVAAISFGIGYLTRILFGVEV
jgi:VIT1/CCC1 family predicted Fe2+/Mn2+ transporter